MKQAILSIVFVCGATLVAQQQPAGTERPKTTDAQKASSGKAATAKGAPDESFALTAAQANLGEVELGKLAQQQGQHADVKQFGMRMVTDHMKAYDQLKQAASGLRMALPSTPGATQNQQKQKLSGLSGEAFDKQYASLMIEDHKKAIALFQGEAEGGMNAELKSYAKMTLPTLQQHLQMAEMMAKMVSK